MVIRWVLFSFLFIILSCKQEKTYHNLIATKVNLKSIWRLTEIEMNDSFYDSSNGLDKRKVMGQIAQGYMLSLFPEGEATRLIDNDMTEYQWHFYKNNSGQSQLILSNDFGRDTFTNLVLEENKGFVFMTCKYKDIGIYKFHRAHEMLDSYKLDPYYSENNRWRIPSEKYETKEQLKSRLFNYLTHYKCLLNSSAKRASSKIRLNQSEGILRVFDGGIGLKQRNQLPKKWLHSYYSDSQAYEVYDRLEKHFKNRVIKKKTQAGWRLDNASIIDSLLLVY